MSLGASGEEVQVGVFGGWIDVGVLVASLKNWVAGPPERWGKWIQFAQRSP